MSDAAKLLRNRDWRLRNLYYIRDKDGNRVLFKPNEEQEKLFSSVHKRTLILKSRQLGITTGYCIMWLDLAMFSNNLKIGIIAHTKDDAKVIFRDKIKFAYDNLPPDLKAAVGLDKLDTEEIVLGNGSSIRVSVSFRSSTTQILHITEFGYVCAKEPQRAEEIVTGAMQSVPKQGYIIMESTAKGRCYDDKTEILTSDGWMPFSSLTGREGILTMNPDDRIAYYQNSWSKVEQDYRGPMVRYKCRSIDMSVTPNHMMWLSRQKGKMRFEPAIESLRSTTDFYFQKTFKWNADGISHVTIPEYTHVQGNGFRTHKPVDVPIDIWLDFFGLWLSDGGMSWAAGSKNVNITQVKFQEEARAYMQALCDVIGCKMAEREHGNGKRFSTANAQLASFMLNFWKPKRIGRELLMAMSSEQCKRLLRSIDIGDGCTAKRNRGHSSRIYAGIDKEFQDDVQELALKAGYSSSVYGPARNREVTASSRAVGLLRTNKKPYLEPYEGKVYCVSLPKDHLLMVRRNGIACWSGNSGAFYDMVNEAQKKPPESQLDWKLIFLPWWQHPEYAIDDPRFQLYEHETNYILELQKKIGQAITPQQANWWARKYRELGENMFSENPSTPEEAFRQSVEGAYYKQQMLQAWQQKRVVDLPIEPGLAVDTWWDLGMADAMAIVFVQRFGGWINVIDYYENSGEGLAHYVDYLHKWRDKNKVVFNRHIGPHDLGVRELGTGETRLERARQLGIVFDVAPRLNLDDGIEAVRNLLPKCRFDAIRCEKLVKSLETYRKEWDDRLGRWKDKPFHGPESHAADAVRYGATVFGRMQRAGAPALQREVKRVKWTLT